MQAFSETSHALVAKPSEFAVMQSALQRLRYLATRTSSMRVVPKQPRQDFVGIQQFEAYAADVCAEVGHLRQGQDILKKEITDLRGEMNSMFKSLGAQLTTLLTLQQKLIDKE